MISLIRTKANHPDFISLVRMLDAELAEIDGSDHSFYDQFNKLDGIKHAVIAYENNKPVSCGALKEFSPGITEVKRMYTLPAYRGKGIATTVLTELEQWAAELSFSKCILETGKRQPEAIRLYQKNRYIQIPNYGQYKDDDNSVCFEKILSVTG
jgi:GNAT superfamily N-acetyltransferase